jgi:hypothetical protein
MEDKQTSTESRVSPIKSRHESPIRAKITRRDESPAKEKSLRRESPVKEQRILRRESPAKERHLRRESPVSPTKFPIGQYQEFIRQQRELQNSMEMNGRESLGSRNKTTVAKKKKKKVTSHNLTRSTSAPRPHSAPRTKSR